MTEIYNISPGFLITYATYQGKKKIDMEEVFKRLSFEMGGDGKTITKKQLDSYISNAESGNIDVDESKLDALKMIQKNWDTISKGADSITYDNMKDYSSLLAATLIGNFTVTEINDSTASATDAIYDYLVDYLGLSSKDDVTKTDLTTYLNELVTTTSSGNETNSELIGTLTNMIASFTPTSTVEVEA